MSSAIDLGTLYASVELRLGGLNKGIADAEAKLKSFEGIVKNKLDKPMADFAASAGRNMVIAGAALTVPIGAAIKKSAEFDQAMRNTNSLLKLNETGFQDLKKSIMGVVDDPKIRQGPVDLAKGMYDIASSGFTGQKALDILKQSAYGASAGMTDTATSSRALMSVLNSGIGGVKDAREAMDVLFRAVDRGVFSFGELAGSIGDVLPTAKIMKVNIQEVTAALATMTKQGLNVAEAQTALNNLMIHVAKPSKEAKTIMDELGISYGVTAMEGKGLAGWLQEVIDKTHGNTHAMIKLMPEMRGMKGELLLAGDGLKMYREDLKAAATATDGLGATQAALTEQNKGAQAQYELLKKEVEKLAVDVGTKLLPVMRDLLSAVKSGVEWFDKLPDPIKTAGIQLAAFGAVALTVTGSILSLIIKLKELAAMPVAMRLLGLGGGVAVAGVAAKDIYDMATNGSNPNIQYFGAMGGVGPASQGYFQLRERMVKDNAINDSIRSGAGDMAEQRALRNRVAPVPVTFKPPKGVSGKWISPEDAADARDKAKDIARANREAQIEALRLSQDAAKRELAAQKEADDEYIKMVNEMGVKQETAFRVRREKYREAHDSYLKEIVAAGVKEYEAETKALEQFDKKQEMSQQAKEMASGWLNSWNEEAKSFKGEAWSDGLEAMFKGLDVAYIAELQKWLEQSAPGKTMAESLAESINAALHATKMIDVDPESIDAIIKKGEDAIGYAKAGNDADKVKKVKDTVNTTKELLKGLQRDAAQVMSGLFEDLLSGHKNPFQSFADAFKSMLIKMAAEFAASKLMQMLSGMFGKKGGGLNGIAGPSGIQQGNSTSGTIAGLAGLIPGIGGAVGAGIGALGSIFGFAEGGRPPVGRFSLVGERGPELVKFDRAATVYPNGVMPTGVDEMGGGINIHGPIHIHGVTDLDSLSRALGVHIRRALPVR